MRSLSRLTKFAVLLLALGLLFTPLTSQEKLSLSVDPVYADLERAIRETPAEAMDLHWLSARVYGRAEDCQRYLKLILSGSEHQAKNARLARLRLAANLEALSVVAQRFGVTLELTDSGSQKGHVSDLDFTVLILGGDDVSFEEFKTAWDSEIRARGVEPSRADVNLFDGRHMLPDWKNPNISAASHVSTVAREVLFMRGEQGYYVSPGANRETVQRRALEQGRTIQLAGGAQGEVIINGAPIDLAAFLRGEADILWRPTREASILFRDIHPEAQVRTALGSGGENLRQWLQHLSDPKAAHKYVDRILDNALAPMTRAMEVSPGQYRTYTNLHFDEQISDADKSALKERMVRELYGPELPDVAVREYVSLFDTTLRVIYTEGYDPSGLFASWHDEARRNLSLTDPEAASDPSRIAQEAERIHFQRLTEALAGGLVEVLTKTMRNDLTVDGVMRQQAAYGGDRDTVLQNVEKMFAERRIEIVHLFEAIELIDDPKTRQRLRKQLIDAAPDPRMTRIVESLSKLAQAGPDSVKRWLGAAAESGVLPPATGFFEEVEGKIRPVLGDLDEAASDANPRDVRVAVGTAVALSAGIDASKSYQGVSTLLSDAASAARNQGSLFLADCYDNMDFLFWAGTATSMIGTYQQVCLRGGASGDACRDQVLSTAGQEILFNIPAVERYGGALIGYWKVNQGDISGLKDISFSIGHIAGATLAMQAYAVATLVGGVYDITYGYLVDQLEDDLVDQALKADLTFGNPPTRRCSTAILEQRQLPEFPLFGGPGEIRVPSEKLLGQDRLQAAEGRFGNVVRDELRAAGIRKDSFAWRQQFEERLRVYACELPYYERMQQLYPYLHGKLTEGMLLADHSSVVIDACLDARRKSTEDAEAQAAAQGAEALETFFAEQARKPREFSQCLQRGVETASPAVKGLIAREVESWLQRQPVPYQEHFYTTWEWVTEGTRIADSVRRAGEAVGSDMTTRRAKIVQSLAEHLVPQFVYSRYSAEKRDDMRWQMEQQLAARAALMKRAYRLMAASRVGEERLAEEFGRAYVERARAVNAQAQSERSQLRVAPPELALDFPGYAVALGDTIPIEVRVRGDEGSKLQGTQQSPWSIVVRTQVEDSVSRTAPPDLIVTPQLAARAAEPGTGLFALKQKVIAELADGEGRVLSVARGTVNLYDLRPVPSGHHTPDGSGGTAEEAAVTSNLNEARNQFGALRGQIASAAQDAARLCAEARQSLRFHDQLLSQARSALERAGASADRGNGQADLTNLASEAIQVAAAISESAQAADQVRRRVEAIALGVCEQMADAPPDGELRLQFLNRMFARVQEANALLSESDRAAQSASDATTRLRQIAEHARGLPPSPSLNDADQSELRAASGPNGIRAMLSREPANLTRLREAVQNLLTLQQELQAASGLLRDRIMQANPPDGMDAIAASTDLLSQAQQAVQSAVVCRDEVVAQFVSQQQEAERVQSELEARLRQQRVPEEGSDVDFNQLLLRADSSGFIASENAQAARERAQDAALCLAVSENPPPHPVEPPVDCLELQHLTRAALQRNLLEDAERFILEGQTCPWVADAARALREAATNLRQNCASLQQRFSSFLQQGDLAAAQSLIPHGEICGFADDLRSALRDATCNPVLESLHQAIMARDARAAQAIMQQAQQQGCRVPGFMGENIRILMNSRPAPNIDTRVWAQAMENLRRTYEAWLRANGPDGGANPSGGGGGRVQPPPINRPEPAEHPASDSEKQQLTSQIRATYTNEWYPRWCPERLTSFDSGCAIRPRGARDELLQMVQSARYRSQLERVRRLLPCYGSCITGQAKNAQAAGNCITQCRTNIR